MKLKSRIHLDSSDRRRRRGGALVLVAFATATLAVLALGVTSIGMSSTKEQRAVHERLSSLYVAEAGVSDAYAALAAAPATNNNGVGWVSTQNAPGNLGTASQPVDYGGSSYYVTRVNNADQTISLISTGSGDNSQSRVELVLKTVNTSIWQWGAFGELGVVMDSNAHVDSYVSTLGTYASQQVNGIGASAYALSNGNVGSNADILIKQNAVVNGAAVPGPGSTTQITGNAVVSGSTSPASTPQALPAITVPSIPSSGIFAVPLGTTATLPSGSYHWTSAGLGKGSTLNVTGPATLVCDSLRLMANSSMVIDATAGPVSIYVINDFVMSSNTHIYPTSYSPQDVMMYLESDNIIDPDLIVDLDQIDFQSNSSLFGTIYAPHAKVTINSNFELFGAIVARDLVLDSWSRVHFDEALLNVTSNTTPTYSRVCFRILASP